MQLRTSDRNVCCYWTRKGREHGEKLHQAADLPAMTFLSGRLWGSVGAPFWTSHLTVAAGERVQLHMIDRNVCNYWSRKGYDHGEKSNYDIFDAVIQEQSVHDTVVLDGELILWNWRLCALAHCVPKQILRDCACSPACAGQKRHHVHSPCLRQHCWSCEP